MARLVIPRCNAREKEIFERHNIHLVEEMEIAQFESLISHFLGTHNVLHLATSKQDVPRCTPLEYWNIGMDVFIVSEGGGKIPNLKANPRVCYSISDPFTPQEDFFGCVGLQVWGLASVFKKNDNPERFRELFGHSHYIQDPEGMRRQGIDIASTPINFNVISIEPTKIRYLNIRDGYRNVMWKCDQ